MELHIFRCGAVCKTTCLPPIWQLLACERASKLTTNVYRQSQVIKLCYKFHILTIIYLSYLCICFVRNCHHRLLAMSKYTVYPKKSAHGFVVLCFVVVMQSFIMNSHEVFIHIQQGCFAGTGAIVRLPQCQWSKPDGYGEVRQCLTTTKHSKAVTVCIFLGIYCMIQARWFTIDFEIS